MLDALTDRRAALVIAHPGHELRVFNWLALARPTVFVLTDGSGRSGASRLYQTTRILAAAGARPGPIYGRFTDAEFYAAILKRDASCFVKLGAELRDSLQDKQIDYVVSDAVEGYNPAHDICHSITSAVVAKLCRSGRCLQGYEVLLAKADRGLEAADTEAISIKISPAACAEKLRAAGNYSELASDLCRIVQEEGIDAFNTESLRPMKPLDFAPLEPVFYETYGEEQVRRGHYSEVIRYRRHIVPIVEALRNFAEGRAREATCEF